MNWRLTNFCEIDKYASKAYCAIHGVDESLNLGDITKVNPDEIEDFSMICGGSPCFVAGTQIFTDKGYKNIEDIRIGDMVLSHDCQFHKVIDFGMNTQKEIYELQAFGIEPIRATGNHPFYVRTWSNGILSEPYKKPLHELTQSDCLGRPTILTPFAHYQEPILWRPVISVVKLNELADVYNMTVEDTHTYTANDAICFNCQDFSVAGKQKGATWTCKDCGYQYNPLTVHWNNRDICPNCGSTNLEVTRSSLLIEFLRMVRTKKPEWGVYENVKNIVGSAFKDSFKLFETELQEYNYNTHWKVLNAKQFGVPQNRERLFLVFIRKDVDNGQFKFPEPFPLTIKLKDILEETVDDKYYMKPDKIKLLTESLKAKEIKQVAQIYPDSGNPQAGRVYDSEGISPAMDTCQGGNRMPKVMCGIDKSVNNTSIIEVANCITAREDRGVSNRQAEGTAVVEIGVQKVGNVNPSGNGMNGNVFGIEGVAPTVTTNKGEGNKILVPDTNVPVRLGNIYGEQFGTGYAGNVWDKEAISPTLMTMQGGNRQPLIVEEETKILEPVNPMPDGTCRTLKAQYYKTSQANYERTGSMGATGVCEGSVTNYRIRKLTPKECWRLQAFPDWAIEKAIEAKISNSQLYKMAGNAICVDCLYYIFKELYAAMPYLFENMTVGSFFSGIGSFEISLDKLQKFTEENEHPLISTESSEGDAICVAMRGRYNEDGKVEQHLEPRFDGVTNTITTVQKDNLVAISDNSPVTD